MSISAINQLLEGPERPSFCVDMTISSEKVKYKPQAKVYLDINFFIEEKELPLGRVLVGITKGRLSLKIENGTMPLEKRGLVATLPLEIEIKHTETKTFKQSDSAEESVQGQVGLGTKNRLSLTDAAKQTTAKEHSGTATNEYPVIEAQVWAGGNEEKPFWDFEVKTGQGALKGGRLSENLGEINISKKPCKIDAVFNTRPRFLWVSGSEGIWPSNMNDSNRAIRKLIIWKWLKSKVDPYLNCQTMEC